jgi:nucleotide-binding universal stress UspA family protein
MPGIVVGVDGSPNSARALAWATKEAALAHADLTVLAVHQAVASYMTGNPVVFGQDAPEMETTRKTVEELVRRAQSESGEAKPAAVNIRVVHGFPAQELIDASKDAAMVVVGSRGSGGFARLLVGSVSNQVVHHAACPVVIVPHER